MVHQQTLRIIDANLNRICEGLRVLEDIARFVVEDKNSSRQYKAIRHELRQTGNKLGIVLEKSRDADGDIGADLDLPHNYRDFSSVIRANSKRVEEGLRVLEELSKLTDLSGILAGETLKKYRYSVYTLSKDLILALPNDTNND